jgi:hypothetical protein
MPAALRTYVGLPLILTSNLSQKYIHMPLRGTDIDNTSYSRTSNIYS